MKPIGEVAISGLDLEMRISEEIIVDGQRYKVTKVWWRRPPDTTDVVLSQVQEVP